MSPQQSTSSPSHRKQCMIDTTSRKISSGSSCSRAGGQSQSTHWPRLLLTNALICFYPLQADAARQTAAKSGNIVVFDGHDAVGEAKNLGPLIACLDGPDYECAQDDHFEGCGTIIDLAPTGPRHGHLAQVMSVTSYPVQASTVLYTNDAIGDGQQQQSSTRDAIMAGQQVKQQQPI